MSIFLLLACRIPGSKDSPTPPADSADPEPAPLSVYWGDLHAHSGYSADACEDPARECAPRGATPALDFFARAEANGLDFVALTDHAEFSTWTNLETGETRDIWADTLALAQSADGSGVLPVVGYEWTASTPKTDGSIGAHRTVLLDRVDPCPAWRVPGRGFVSRKEAFGHEGYTANPEEAVLGAAGLAAALAAAATTEGCEAAGWISFLHHPAVEPPAAVDWAEPDLLLPDERLVEIHSEHGASECVDLGSTGCDFEVNTERHAPEGSVQAALAAGLRLGFVGGTDGHDGNPGSLLDGPSPYPILDDTDGDGVEDTPRLQFTAGAITGVLLPADATLDRPALFDALDARHTLVSTWRPEALTLLVVGADGQTWFPGDTIPAESNPLTVTFDVGGVPADGVIVAPSGDVEAFDGALDLSAGEPRYLRFDLDIEGVTQRVWLSPFFPG